jgi:probable rRNA maturation factor
VPPVPERSPGWTLALQVAPGLKDAPSQVWCRRWVAAALAAARHRSAGAITVRLVGSREGTRLNEGFRRKAGPTNVLAFPGNAPRLPGLPRHLGDLAICLPVVRREARAQGKTLRQHLAHLLVHGTLHLLGHTHDGARDARRMEGLETRILLAAGLPDPYATVAAGSR